MKILVVEDDSLIQLSLLEMLKAWGYACDHAEDGELAWDLASQYPYDLILLDLNLPRLDGLALCQRLRSRLEQQPLILMLTARDSSFDKVLGLEDGADDYMVKPFDPDVLRARLRALLRRANRPLQLSSHWGSLDLERGGQGADYAGQPLQLTPTEHRILETLLQAAGSTCSKEKILNAAWTLAESPGEESVKTHIKNIRAKLAQVRAPADLIETVYGIGFRLNPDHAT